MNTKYILVDGGSRNSAAVQGRYTIQVITRQAVLAINMMDGSTAHDMLGERRKLALTLLRRKSQSHTTPKPRVSTSITYTTYSTYNTFSTYKRTPHVTSYEHVHACLRTVFTHYTNTQHAQTRRTSHNKPMHTHIRTRISTRTRISIRTRIRICSAHGPASCMRTFLSRCACSALSLTSRICCSFDLAIMRAYIPIALHIGMRVRVRVRVYIYAYCAYAHELQRDIQIEQQTYMRIERHIGIHTERLTRIHTQRRKGTQMIHL